MMRHRPDLWRRRDGGGRHDRPFRRDEVSPCENRVGNRTSVQGPARRLRTFPHRARHPRECPARRPRTRRARTRPVPPGGRPRRPRSSARAPDRGPCTSRRSASGSAASRSRSSSSALARHGVALDPVAVVLDEPEVDRRELRRGAADAHRDDRHRRARRRARRPRSRRARPRRARRARRRVGGSACRWRSRVADDADLGRDVEDQLVAGADHELGRAAADVDDQHGRRRPARVAVAPSEVSRASSSPDSVRGLEAVAVAHRRGELGAVGGVAHRRGHHRGAHRGAVRSMAARVTRRARRTRAPAARRRGGRWRRRPRRAASRSTRAPARAARRRRPRRPAAASSWCRCRRRRPASCDRVRHRAAVERREQVVDGHGRHPRTRAHGGRADVRDDEQVRARRAAGGRRAAARGR